MWLSPSLADVLDIQCLSSQVISTDYACYVCLHACLCAENEHSGLLNTCACQIISLACLPYCNTGSPFVSCQVYPPKWHHLHSCQTVLPAFWQNCISAPVCKHMQWHTKQQSHAAVLTDVRHVLSSLGCCTCQIRQTLVSVNSRLHLVRLPDTVNASQEEHLQGTEMAEQPTTSGNSRNSSDSSSTVQRSPETLHQPADGPSTSDASSAATVTPVPTVPPMPTGPAGASRKQSSSAANSGE